MHFKIWKKTTIYSCWLFNDLGCSKHKKDSYMEFLSDYIFVFILAKSEF